MTDLMLTAEEAGSGGFTALDTSLGALGEGLTFRCGCVGCLKAAGVYDELRQEPGSPTAIVPVAGDDIQDDTTTTDSIEVMEGQAVHAALEHAGDQDYFRISLSAGQRYEFTLTPDDVSGLGPDLLFEIRDAAGNLVQSFDSGGAGAVESWDFTATADGLHFLNVAGYLNLAVGGYTIEGKLDDDPPPANEGTPLEAIDWGGTENRVDTDGVETADGADVIQVYFSQLGEVYLTDLGPSVSVGWQDYEKAAAMTAFQQYENVIDVHYAYVSTREEADFVLVAAPTAPVLLGRMSPPGENYEGQGEFNVIGAGWNEASLAQGGYGYVTLIHEFGHGMGLAHPHDTGGGSEVMQGVASDTDPGVFNLNQGVYTTMSYRSGNPDGRNGGSDSDNYGYEGTLGAFDVAVLQQKYGANTDFASGDDVYALKDVNAAGTFYACIWDTGGVDEIRFDGTQDAIIDIRAATLKYEVGGGGFISDVEGIFGGFTIANGVRIENATGGAGADDIGGNDYANHLSGAGGADKLNGRGRADVLDGGAGVDQLRGGRGADTFVFSDAADTGKGRGARDQILDFGRGDKIDLSGIDAVAGGEDDAFAFVTAFTGVAGQATVRDVGKFALVQADLDGDGEADFTIAVRGSNTVEATDFIL